MNHCATMSRVRAGQATIVIQRSMVIRDDSSGNVTETRVDCMPLPPEGELARSFEVTELPITSEDAVIMDY